METKKLKNECANSTKRLFLRECCVRCSKGPQTGRVKTSPSSAAALKDASAISLIWICHLINAIRSLNEAD